MLVICIWCNRDVGIQEPVDVKQTVAGICLPCAKMNFPDLFKLKQKVLKDAEERMAKGSIF